MDFTLNGKIVSYNNDLTTPLLKYLREHEGITSPKDGCSGQGSCGACTVELDGKAVLSCVIQMKKVEGKSVTTTEGMEQNIQDAFALAFVEKGGIQCGFCIPGIVMSARCLLKKNNNPTKEEILKAIDKNICRCTGYVKVVDSILYAAAIIRGEITPQKIQYTGKIGERLPKYEAYDKVLGKHPFVCDMKIDGMLYGALKFSDHPRAIIKKIDCSIAEKIPGVKRIFTDKDIPGNKMIGLIYKDWPMMIGEGETTHYTGDVICGVVATTEEIAREAVSKIHIDYEVLTPVTTAQEALAPNAPIIGPKSNTLSQSRLQLGNAEEAFKNAAYVSKGIYHTQRIEHAFLETECAIATPWKLKEEKGILLYSQGQGAYEDRKQVAQILNLPLECVNVIQVQNGGAFGGKEDLTVQGHTALFSWHLDAPVRVSLSRSESLSMHPKRHPMELAYELACDKNGKLTALRGRILSDSGAYASVGMKVLERAAGHASGAYVIPNIDVEAVATYTNNVPCGAMRGFGVNQAAFAMEGCIDELCEMGKFDRWQFRFDNAICEGETLSTGQVMGKGVGLKKTLLAVKDVFQKAKYAGIACGIKNTGVGNGMSDIGNAKIVIKSGEKIVLHHGWTEMGQGVHTMAIHFFCELTGLSPDMIEVKVETQHEIICGMTTSSRGTSLVGNALIDACKKLNADLEKYSLTELIGREYLGHWSCDWTSRLGEEKPGFGHVTHYSYGYATQVVVLNEETGAIQKIYAAHDGGKIMNANLFEGQIEGAVHMGLGYALSEDFPCENGRPKHLHYGKLGIIKAKDMPEVEVIGVEEKDPHGPFGAKGVGEIGLVPTAGAVANAFYQYDKKRRYSLPMGTIKK